MPAKKPTLKSTSRSPISDITGKKAAPEKAAKKAARKAPAKKVAAKKVSATKLANTTGKAVPKTSKPANKTATPKSKITDKQVKESASFAKAQSKAQQYANDPQKLEKLFEDAEAKAKKVEKGPFGETWAYLLAMIRLIRAYAQGRYRDIPWTSLLLIVVAVVYFVSPIDFIPDAFPLVGHIDDALVVSLTLRQVKADLDAFIEWEMANS